MSAIRTRLKNTYYDLDRLSSGRLDLFRHAVQRFSEMRGGEAAATQAYFTLFSLFPLLLFLVALTSFILQSNEAAYRSIAQFIGNALPVQTEDVEASIREVLELRSEIGIIGLLALLWAASSFFTTLARNINRAWPSVKLRNPIQSRLVGIGMVGALFLLLLLSLASSAFAGMLPALFRFVGGDDTILRSGWWRLVLRLVPALFSFLMFLGLYHWVPNKSVRWRAVLWGAIFTTLAWETAKQMFAYLLSSGLVNYEFIYGSLGTMVMLMFWSYVSNLMVLFGAYLVATIDLRSEQTEKQSATGGPAEPGSGNLTGSPTDSSRPAVRQQTLER